MCFISCLRGLLTVQQSDIFITISKMIFDVAKITSKLFFAYFRIQNSFLNLVICLIIEAQLLISQVWVAILVFRLLILSSKAHDVFLM